jgi:hypothetical protein
MGNGSKSWIRFYASSIPSLLYSVRNNGQLWGFGPALRLYPRNERDRYCPAGADGSDTTPGGAYDIPKIPLRTMGSAGGLDKMPNSNRNVMPLQDQHKPN